MSARLELALMMEGMKSELWRFRLGFALVGLTAGALDVRNYQFKTKKNESLEYGRESQGV